MHRRPFGPTRCDVPIIGQGTWNIEEADRASAVAALRQGLDLGMTHLDTAEIYGKGMSETIVGEAVAGRRDEVFLISKVAPRNASRQGTITACEQSLKRLGTDRLDCYLLHWRESGPLEDTIAAFEALQRDGKIRSWGVSNFDVADLEDVLAIAGEGRLTCNQVLYYPGERAIEHRVIPWCAAHGVAVVAYSPFGHGDFPGSDEPSGRVLAEIGSRHRATARQVALAYLTRFPSVFAIPKAAGADHVADNAGAGRLELSDQDVAAIDRAFPLGPIPVRLPTI